MQEVDSASIVWVSGIPDEYRLCQLGVAEGWILGNIGIGWDRGRGCLSVEMFSESTSDFVENSVLSQPLSAKSVSYCD